MKKYKATPMTGTMGHCIMAQIFDEESGLSVAHISSHLGSEEATRLAKTFAAAPEMREVLIELLESAEYWSEYDVPLGIVDRMKKAISYYGVA